MCQKPIRTGKQLGDQSEKTAFLMQENGETGIRTRDTGLTPYNGLANRRLQPLGHLSSDWNVERYSTREQNASARCASPNPTNVSAGNRANTCGLKPTGRALSAMSSIAQLLRLPRPGAL